MIALIQRLRQYNQWRRGADIEQPNHTQLGIDIDDAIKILETITETRTIPDDQKPIVQ